MAEDIDNIINVTDVASKGVVFDTPPVALAPNIMTNVRNVRFRDGAIRKMEGELLLTDLEVDNGADNTNGIVSTVPAGYKLGDVQYFAVWEEPSISPNQCYYITVRDFVLINGGIIVGQKVFIQNAIKSTDAGYAREDITPPLGTALTGATINFTKTTGSSDTAVGSTTIALTSNTNIIKGHYVSGTGIPEGAKVTNINGNNITINKPTDVIVAGGATLNFKLYPGFSVTTTGWGHTLFGGGFAFILNNGIDRPHHIKLDPEASAITDIELLQLPGWDSYYGHSEPVLDTWGADPDFVPVFALGQELDFSLNTLYVTKTRGTTTTVLVPEAGTPAGSNAPSPKPYYDVTTTVQGAFSTGDTTLNIPFAVTNPNANPRVRVGDYVFLENKLGIPKNATVTKITQGNNTGTASTIFLSVAITVNIASSTVIRFIAPPGREVGYKLASNFVPGAYPGDAAWVSPTTHALTTLNEEVPYPDFYQVYYNEDTGITVVSIGGLEKDDKVSIQIRTRNIIKVSCGIIEAFGNLIVAGNLKTTDATNTSKTLRRQPGVIRVSDVAATDSFPTNWNPFASSVSTADEFTLSETSVVKDMKTLQSNFYIYSTQGIHQLRLTGNLKLPVAFSSVTETYGALSTKSVVEYDGRHFVVGKNDIYSFTGNPADIKSLCDNRTRVYFYNNLNPSFLDKTFVLANHRENEIWINYPTIQSTTGECNESLIYNYRDNTWTIRDLNDVKAGDIGPVVGGGIPQATLALNNGSSGNNADTGNAGYTNVSNAQVQTTVFGTQPAPTALQHRWWSLKRHEDIKVRYDFLVDDTFTGDTVSNRQSQRFTWAADTGQYSSSGTTNGVVKPLTWVLYITNGGGGAASIGITLTPGLTTLSDILEDIVTKMNTQAADYWNAFNTKYYAIKNGNTAIDIQATSTGPRDTFPATSSGSSSIPANGVFFYGFSGYQGQFPQTNRLDASSLTGANFPVPTIQEVEAGTTVSGKPEITGSLTLRGVGLNSDAVYPLFFDGLINITTIKNKISYFINVKFPEKGYTAVGTLNTGGIAPPSGFSGFYILANDSGSITGNTAPVFTTTNNTTIPPAEVLFQYKRNGRAAGTADTITFNFPLGQSFSITLTPNIFDPDSSNSFGSNDITNPTEEEEPSFILNRIVTTYNASFGGVGQPTKYFVPTIVTGSSPNPFSIAWARPAADAAPNVDPITWSVTNGTARVGYTYPTLTNNNNNAAVLYGDSVANLVTTNTGSAKAYTTLTRATLKIINNGVSTTVLDKRYGEGPGRLTLEPLGGINGLGENPYGSTNATTNAEYLALFYDAGTTSGSVPNGIAVSLTNILKDVVTALASNTSLSVVATPNTTSPTSVVITPLEYSSTTNYVESFTVSTGAEAQTAPARTQFIGQNREGQTVAGTNSTLASTSVVNTTLSNIRPWSTNEVNDLKKFPIFAQSEIIVDPSTGNPVESNRLRVADLGFDFAGTEYVSFFERDQLSITTTFNTETVNSMVLWADGFTREDVTNNLLRATLHIRTRGTNASGTESLLTSTDTNDAKLVINSFVVATDYKVDARVQGRFINYRIDDAALDYTAANNREWHVSGLQLETLRGGTR
jgi:hypothetical protein